jgi:cell division control protein 6
MTVTTRALRSRGQEQPVLPGKQIDEEASGAIRSFSRNCPSPAPSTCSSTSSSRRVRTHSFRSSHSFSTPSFSSPMSKTKSSAGQDDSDESEDERQSTRLGGCQRSVSTRGPDDSNKENIAPFRHLTQAALEQETMIAQEESVAQRTRARGAAPMSDRSLSHAGSTAGSSHAGSAMTRLRSFRRTVSTPITRKRQRGILDLDDLTNGGGDADFRTPSTPSSRLRLDLQSACIRSPAEDAESYFSSQATSIFDNMSVGEGQTELSRCTTPDVQEADDTQTIKSKQTKQKKQVTLPSFANIFTHAKSLLRYGAGTDTQVVGRERERSCLQRFLQKRFNLFAHLEHSASPQGEAIELDGAPESGSLYICGLPGTGKTALVRSIIADLEQGEKTPKIAFVDCMSIQHPREVFAKILEALGQSCALSQGEQDDTEAERRVGVLVKDPRRRTLIVLDEIDHLLRNRAHQNILYRLFSWGATSSPVHNDQSGSCALIGIANSLDLTERFVPLLASKGAAPAVLNFRPFEAAEITTVLQARLSQLYPRYDIKATEDLIEMDQESTSTPLIQEDAMMLATRKIAAATGDLRKALDACRLAIDMIESEETSKAENRDLSHFTTTSAPKVKPAHVLKVLAVVLGSPKLNKIRDLGIQSKLVLLAIFIAQKRQSAKLDVLGSVNTTSKTTSQEMSIRDIECTYTAMLKNDDAGALPSVESSELMDVIEGLEVEGIVRIISDATTSKSSSSSRGAMGLSPSGKRAAKKQLLASNRALALVMSSEEVLKGICTASPSSAVETSKVVLEAMNRVWNRENDRVQRCKSWESMAEESKKVIDEELGGGRGALGF